MRPTVKLVQSPPNRPGRRSLRVRLRDYEGGRPPEPKTLSVKKKVRYVEFPVSLWPGSNTRP